jgi:uncharacterized membrane protein
VKKLFTNLIFSFVSASIFAQEDQSPAYKTGYAIGQVVGYALVAGLIIWGISKLFKKK